jgi:hypothetical protein
LYVLFRAAESFGPIDWSTTIGEAWLKIAIWGLPSFALVAVAYRLSPRGALAELGLWANPVVGCLIALAAALPLFVWISHGIGRLPLSRLADDVLLGPFAEEVLFRGVLFRQLYRRAGRSVVRAMVVSAVVFGVAHLSIFDFGLEGILYPGQLASLSALVGEATLGGLLFAWLTYRWGSIWPAIGLHSSLNLTWDLTTGGGNSIALMMRVAAVVIAVALTLLIGRRTAANRWATADRSAI